MLRGDESARVKLEQLSAASPAAALELARFAERNRDFEAALARCDDVVSGAKPQLATFAK